MRMRARAASRADMEDLLACRDSVVAIVDRHPGIRSDRKFCIQTDSNCQLDHIRLILQTADMMVSLPHSCKSGINALSSDL